LIVRHTLNGGGVPERTIRAFLQSSRVTPKPNSDLLRFTVVDGSPRLAIRLASEYAAQYTRYRRKLDTAAIVTARRNAEAKLEQLQASGDRGSAIYQALAEKIEQLSTLQTLRTSAASLVSPANQADRVQPRPFRNGVLAGILGLVLGLTAAFLWEALDTRVRSAEEAGRRLGLPLLARIPEPPRKLRSNHRLVMLAKPHTAEAEPFRMLRTNLEFVNLQRQARSIMVTSAVEREGKSTTISNLALALAQAGKDIALVDLDLRRPFLDRFFRIAATPGVTDVALGHVDLSEALAPVAMGEEGSRRRTPEGAEGLRGTLHVLPSGPLPPDPGEFVATDALAAVLEQLGSRHDFVLVDAPPMLHVGDTMALSARVDGMIVVTRLKLLRRGMLNELHRLLDASPANKLGFILTGAGRERDYYGYGGYDYSPPRRSRTEAGAYDLPSELQGR
jgi:tyrosine-protein kinase